MNEPAYRTKHAANGAHIVRRCEVFVGGIRVL